MRKKERHSSHGWAEVGGWYVSGSWLGGVGCVCVVFLLVRPPACLYLSTRCRCGFLFSALVVVVLLVGWFPLVCVVGGACPCVCRAGFHLCSLPFPLLSFISYLLAIAIVAAIGCC